MRESNPHRWLFPSKKRFGKPAYYHYTNGANKKYIYFNRMLNKKIPVDMHKINIETL